MGDQVAAGVSKAGDYVGKGIGTAKDKLIEGGEAAGKGLGDYVLPALATIMSAGYYGEVSAQDKMQAVAGKSRADQKTSQDTLLNKQKENDALIQQSAANIVARNASARRRGGFASGRAGTILTGMNNTPIGGGSTLLGGNY